MLKKIKVNSYLILDSIFSLIRLLRDSGIKNDPFPFAPASRECILLGNGPSLRYSLAEQKDMLQGASLFAFNTMAELEDFAELRPTYYVLSDHVFFSDENYLYVYELLANRISWPLCLICPQGCLNAKIKQILAANRHIKICSLKNTVIEGLPLLEDFCFKHKLGMPPQYNVLVLALMSAIWMGYKRISILGADHNWHNMLSVNEDNTVILRDQHYKQEDRLTPYMRHDNGRTFNMAETLFFLCKTFQAYGAISRFAQNNQINIINNSYASAIDSFSRINNDPVFCPGPDSCARKKVIDNE